MKTKKLIAAVALCGPLLLSNLQAQGLYLGLGVGYGFPAGKQADVEQTSTTSGSVTTNEYTTKNLSLGKGINAGLYVGYMFNKNLGAELGISYLIGGKTTINDKSTGNNSSSTDEYIYKGNMIRFTPALKMIIGENKLRPYMRIGMIVGIAGKLTDEYNYTNTTPGSTSSGQVITEYTGGISLGFHGGLGINYALSDKLSLFGELAGNYQNWAPKKSEITTYTQDGADQLPSMTTYQKETEFLDSFTTTSNSPSNNGVPDQQTKFYLPFSSFGINIGIVLNFGGAE